jgi:activator of HSP90 ATPase
MKQAILLNTTSHPLTRRRIGSAMALAILGEVSRPCIFADSRRQTMTQLPATEANQARTSLHQEMSFPVAPARVYQVLLSSKEFAACTGMPAEIDAKVGGAFSMFGGMIVGRNIELVADQRIVQAWRPANWEPGVYSLVRFEIKPQGSGSAVVLDHTGFPSGDYDHLFSGWGERYWDPMHKYLG